ncbi:hypothetical protein ECFDA505_3670, partial [Escherichia coli FDA505]
MLNSFLKHFL